MDNYNGVMVHSHCLTWTQTPRPTGCVEFCGGVHTAQRHQHGFPLGTVVILPVFVSESVSVSASVKTPKASSDRQ